MRTGIQDFVGDRLRLARQLRALDQQDVAALVGKDKATVSRWESSEQKPEPETLVRLAAALELSAAWFTKPLPKPLGQARFRSQKSELRKFRDRMSSLLLVEVELSLALQRFVDFPGVALPELRAKDPRDIQSSQIEHAAATAREGLGVPLGPVPNVIDILERHGVVVARARIGGEKLDGVSQWWATDDRPYILLSDDKLSETRSRFDAAHELGHLVLHRSVEIDESDPEIYKLMESQANRFASAFLLPEESFAADLRMITLPELQELKVKWRVSIAAMLERCLHLSFVDESYYRKLRTYFSSRGWNKREPLDGELEMERPRMLSDAVRLCFDSGVATSQSLIAYLHAPSSELEELAGVPPGTLSPPSNVVRLKRGEPS